MAVQGCHGRPEQKVFTLKKCQTGFKCVHTYHRRAPTLLLHEYLSYDFCKPTTLDLGMQLQHQLIPIQR